MTLAAALPRDMPTLQLYFWITVMLSILGWTGLARVVRGKLLALREEDYALAARGAGASNFRIITRHLLPGFTSHLIVSITFSVPGMILSETALSFIGVGIQPPAVSWGTLLQDCSEPDRHCPAELADDPGPVGDCHRAAVQLRRGRAARRRRPIQSMRKV